MDALDNFYIDRSFADMGERRNFSRGRL